MTKDMNIRDIQADYRAAMIEEYNSYVTAGRKADAEHVARVLKYTFDYDVSGAAKRPEPEPPVERAVPAPPEPPAGAAEPARRGPGRPRKNPPE